MPRSRWMALFCLSLLVVAISGAVVSACRSRAVEFDRSAIPHEPLVDASEAVRPVRVLIGSNAATVRLRSVSPIELESTSERPVTIPTSTEWVVLSAENGQLLLDGSPIAAQRARILGSVSQPVSVAMPAAGGWGPHNNYPGELIIESGETTGLRLINRVDVETYVGCVIPCEVWPTFHREALRVQAIISRTFALFHMHRRNGAAYDLRAGEGHQVYRGLRTDEIGRRAREAVASTGGVVCVADSGDGEQLFPTYYCAACGGSTESAEVFDGPTVAAPLRGGVSCDYCRIAPAGTYRWGPVQLPASTVFERLVQRYPSAAGIGAISAIETIARGPAGRPTRLQIRGPQGATYDLSAENFRLAVGSNLIRGTDCRITVENGEVRWDRGRGFGHGLGLCQWGAQGQAEQGRSVVDILQHYYPGSRLARAY